MENNKTFLDCALFLAKRGFHVFPLQANSKLPAIKDYPTKATKDEQQIRAWWGKRPYCNIGISTSSYNGGASALLAVDVDNKGEKKGDDEILRLELEGKEFPPTVTQRTPSGGKHLIYRVKEAIGQTAGTIAVGIDTRSRGGYLVGAGSNLDGRIYTLESGLESDPEWAPDWLVQRNPNPKTEPAAQAPRVPIDEKRAKTRAAEWLLSAPLAVQGAGGDQTTFAVAAKLKDFGVDENECFDLLSYPGGWNDRCVPPWGSVELRTKIRNAYAYGRDPIGVTAPETQFKSVPRAAPAATMTDTAGGVAASDGGGGFYLEEMNKKHALIFIKGEHFILHETMDEKNRPTREFMSESSFRRMYSTKTVQEGKGRPRSWADNWLDWPDRREYRGLCFAPGREARNGYYNLWKGFAVKPVRYEDATPEARRGFDMFMEHMLQNVCLTDEYLTRWLLGYFAQMIQRPWERPLTTLVFRGRKGTGKNAPIDRIGKLLGHRHYLVAHSSRYLTSNFNAHLDSCLCMVLDEAFWSGDKSAEGQLKGVTTAPEILIEQKGKEPYMVDNLVRWVVIGNEHWLVPATEDERRYAVFDMGETRMQDNEFFAEMRVLMDERGGGSVLLDYLQRFDLSTVDVNRAPATQGLYEQKVATQEPFFDWWLDSLEAGRVMGSDFGPDWPEDVDREGLRQAFARYVAERRISTRLPSGKRFSTLLKQCAPNVDFDKKRWEAGKTFWIYRLPPLLEARTAWAKRMGHTIKWKEE